MINPMKWVCASNKCSSRACSFWLFSIKSLIIYDKHNKHIQRMAEGQKASPKDRQLEVGVKRAPRLPLLDTALPTLKWIFFRYFQIYWHSLANIPFSTFVSSLISFYLSPFPFAGLKPACRDEIFPAVHCIRLPRPQIVQSAIFRLNIFFIHLN